MCIGRAACTPPICVRVYVPVWARVVFCLQYVSKTKERDEREAFHLLIVEVDVAGMQRVYVRNRQNRGTERQMRDERAGSEGRKKRTTKREKEFTSSSLRYMSSQLEKTTSKEPGGKPRESASEHTKSMLPKCRKSVKEEDRDTKGAW